MSSLALDGTLQDTLIYARPDVDVDGFITIGRRNRVVDANFATDARRVFYIDLDIARLMRSLHNALLSLIFAVRLATAKPGCSRTASSSCAPQ